MNKGKKKPDRRKQIYPKPMPDVLILGMFPASCRMVTICGRILKEKQFFAKLKAAKEDFFKSLNSKNSSDKKCQGEDGCSDEMSA